MNTEPVIGRHVNCTRAGRAKSKSHAAVFVIGTILNIVLYKTPRGVSVDALVYELLPKVDQDE